MSPRQRRNVSEPPRAAFFTLKDAIVPRPEKKRVKGKKISYSALCKHHSSNPDHD